MSENNKGVILDIDEGRLELRKRIHQIQGHDDSSNLLSVSINTFDTLTAAAEISSVLFDKRDPKTVFQVLQIMDNGPIFDGEEGDDENDEFDDEEEGEWDKESRVDPKARKQ